MPGRKNNRTNMRSSCVVIDEVRNEMEREVKRLGDELRFESSQTKGTKETSQMFVSDAVPDAFWFEVRSAFPPYGNRWWFHLLRICNRSLVMLILGAMEIHKWLQTMLIGCTDGLLGQSFSLLDWWMDWSEAEQSVRQTTRCHGVQPNLVSFMQLGFMLAALIPPFPLDANFFSTLTDTFTMFCLLIKLRSKMAAASFPGFLYLCLLQYRKTAFSSALSVARAPEMIEVIFYLISL